MNPQALVKLQNYAYSISTILFLKEMMRIHSATGAALGISINGFTNPQDSYCILNCKGLSNPGSKILRVHQQRFWKSTGSQEPEEPVLTQPLIIYDAVNRKGCFK